MKTFEEALDFRHACKLFDAQKKISDKDLNFILEAGRKSPSSFGMEPWKFLVITNQELKEKLKANCWNQPQISTCSCLVVILCAIEGVKMSSKVPAQRVARRKLEQEKQDMYLNVYSNYAQYALSNDEKTYAWTSKQTYIAAANMMSAAAVLGIDSCPIEGFDKPKVEELLNLDASQWQLSLMLPLGYRKNPQSPQIREPLENIVEFVR